ncbi:MAG: hypothetical protein K1Y36_15060 [Blastocatellia bacterium]|nr:hypothetical protein [Blastocatellia bacterium]
MNHHPSPSHSAILRLEARQLAGFLFAGALIGVVVLGSLATLFDFIRKKLDLTWSPEFVPLLIGFLVVDVLLTVGACWGVLQLFVLLVRNSEIMRDAQREPVKVSFLPDQPSVQLPSKQAEPATENLRNPVTTAIPRNPYQ